MSSPIFRVCYSDETGLKDNKYLVSKSEKMCRHLDLVIVGDGLIKSENVWINYKV